MHNYGNYCTITDKEKNTNANSNKNRHPYTKINTIVQAQIWLPTITYADENTNKMCNSDTKQNVQILIPM